MLLKEIVNQNLTCYHEEISTWKEAIKECCKPLEVTGYISDEYAGEIIKCVETHGPYIVIAPNIAMPHSTLGAKGVKKTGIGFMKVEKPVQFDKNNRERDAQLFFVIASENENQHINNIMMLSTLLSNESLVEELEEVRNDEDLITLINKYEEEGA